MKFSLPMLFAVLCALCIPADEAIGAQLDSSLKRRIISPDFTPPVLRSVRLALFDADSTLRVAPSGKPTANSATDVAILPLLVKPLQKLARQGYLIAILSNQAGIEQGYITIEEADAALNHTVNLLAERGAKIHYYDFAEASNEDRKPNIGMARRLADLVKTRFNKSIDWKHSIMVGDSGWKIGEDIEPDGTPGSDFTNTDRLLAENLQKTYGGTTFHHPRDFFGWKKYGIKNFSNFKELEAFLKEHPELADTKERRKER